MLTADVQIVGKEKKTQSFSDTTTRSQQGFAQGSRVSSQHTTYKQLNRYYVHLIDSDGNKITLPTTEKLYPFIQNGKAKISYKSENLYTIGENAIVEIEALND